MLWLYGTPRYKYMYTVTSATRVIFIWKFTWKNRSQKVLASATESKCFKGLIPYLCFKSSHHSFHDRSTNILRECSLFFVSRKRNASAVNLQRNCNRSGWLSRPGCRIYKCMWLFTFRHLHYTFVHSLLRLLFLHAFQDTGIRNPSFMSNMTKASPR